MFPAELRLRSHYGGRYGAKFIPEGMTIQDFGVTFEKLEPHFDFAEKVFGTSGQAHRVKGQIVGDGNPFDADRSDAFPLPAQKVPYGLHVFMKAARELGFHPFRAPAATVSAPLCCKRPILPLPYHIVLSGASMPATRTAPSSMTMGSYASVLDHQQVADVVTFVRTAWGNRGALATAVQVAKVRKSSTPVDPQGWTAKVP